MHVAPRHGPADRDATPLGRDRPAPGDLARSTWPCPCLRHLSRLAQGGDPAATLVEGQLPPGLGAAGQPNPDLHVPQTSRDKANKIPSPQPSVRDAGAAVIGGLPTGRRTPGACSRWFPQAPTMPVIERQHGAELSPWSLLLRSAGNQTRPDQSPVDGHLRPVAKLILQTKRPCDARFHTFHNRDFRPPTLPRTGRRTSTERSKTSPSERNRSQVQSASRCGSALCDNAPGVIRHARTTPQRTS